MLLNNLSNFLKSPKCCFDDHIHEFAPKLYEFCSILEKYFFRYSNRNRNPVAAMNQPNRRPASINPANNNLESLGIPNGSPVQAHVVPSFDFPEPNLDLEIRSNFPEPHHIDPEIQSNFPEPHQLDFDNNLPEQENNQLDKISIDSMIFSLSVRHHLSGEAVNDIIKLIATIDPNLDISESYKKISKVQDENKSFFYCACMKKHRSPTNFCRDGLKKAENFFMSQICHPKFKMCFSEI